MFFFLSPRRSPTTGKGRCLFLFFGFGFVHADASVVVCNCTTCSGTSTCRTNGSCVVHVVHSSLGWSVGDQLCAAPSKVKSWCPNQYPSALLMKHSHSGVGNAAVTGVSICCRSGDSCNGDLAKALTARRTSGREVMDATLSSALAILPPFKGPTQGKRFRECCLCDKNSSQFYICLFLPPFHSRTHPLDHSRSLSLSSFS